MTQNEAEQHGQHERDEHLAAEVQAAISTTPMASVSSPWTPGTRGGGTCAGLREAVLGSADILVEPR